MRIFNEAIFDRKPDVVVFDLDNTLYAYDEAHRAAMTAVRQKAGSALGTATPVFDRAFDEARKSLKAALGETASSHNRLLYFQRTIEGLGMKTRVSLALDLEQTYWRTFMLSAKLRPSAADFLMDVRSLGATTAILTDLTAQIQFRKIVYFGLEGLIDFVVTSEEAGVDKSGLRPFDVLKAKLAIPQGARVWMIGDDHCDLLAKDALGAATLLLKSGSVEAQADATFTNFADLRRLIGRWSGEGALQHG